MKKEFWSDMAGLIQNIRNGVVNYVFSHVGSGCAPGVYLAVTPAIAV